MPATQVYHSNTCSHLHLQMVFEKWGRYFSQKVDAVIVCHDCKAILDRKRLSRSGK